MFKNSIRDFDMNKKMDIDTLANILYLSFGRDENKQSKRYPSAGALYPVLPLIYVFNENIIKEENIPKGCYLYYGDEQKLFCLKHWSEEDLIVIKSKINLLNSSLYSNICIGYAIDIKKAIVKYGKRGYRHALIEAGAMCQSFREVSNNINENIGDFCWSGFADNALTYLSGLNPRLAPITLIQWFGFRRQS